jgi:hypothetical protein
VAVGALQVRFQHELGDGVRIALRHTGAHEGFEGEGAQERRRESLHGAHPTAPRPCRIAPFSVP